MIHNFRVQESKEAKSKEAKFMAFKSLAHKFQVSLLVPALRTLFPRLPTHQEVGITVNVWLSGRSRVSFETQRELRA